MPKDYVILETFAPLPNDEVRSFDGATCVICGGTIFPHHYTCRVQRQLIPTKKLEYSHHFCMKPATITNVDNAL